MKKVTILGAGTWGSALARSLWIAGNEVRLWSRFPEEIDSLRTTRRNPHLPGMTIPEEIILTADAPFALKDADAVLFVVPSVFIRETARDLAGWIPEAAAVVCASKGIEAGTEMLLTEVIGEEMARKGRACRGLAAISGPTHAEEVALDLPTLIVSASENPEVAADVQALFRGSCIRPYTNSDLRGVEICGALKNVETLAVGIARGIGYGDNTAAALITRGIEEIRRLGLAMGCQERTFFGLAGIGDLIVTATSRHSRNNRAGFLMGQGKSAGEAVREVGMTVEGINALPAAVSLSARYGMEMPIIDAVREIVERGARPADIVRDLMNRKLKEE
ncbi:MAG: NAD(P)-dependent glycerol-3-phosphate dehydrogenase [Clostridia bacterium]|nr:NAD(P)-dependent glycerol-3-phosphate dehydrogenase [Clostridia bacterium]